MRFLSEAGGTDLCLEGEPVAGADHGNQEDLSKVSTSRVSRVGTGSFGDGSGDDPQAYRRV